MNSKYKQDLFYNVKKLPLKDKIDLIETAYKIAYKWWVDELDCSKSFARQEIEMDFETIMKKFNDSAHFVFIHRRVFEDYLEIGFCTMETPIDYYLFLYLNKKHIPMFVKKYNLNIV